MEVKKVWEDLRNDFRAYLTLERGLSVHSIAAYTADVDKLLFFLRQEIPTREPSEIALSDLRSFLIWLSKMGLGASSQARIISGLKAFFSYLFLEQITPRDVAHLLEGPRLSRKIPDVLTYEEIVTILDTIDVSLPLGTRNKAIVEVLYGCGLRVSELTNLRISGLYLEAGLLRVIGKNNKERLVPTGKAAIRAMENYLEHERSKQVIQKGQEDFVFLNRRGKALTRVMVFLIVREAASQAGIRKKVSPHTFRHSFATHLVEGGADLKAIQDMLGHESITTTEIYTHLDTDYLRETIMSFHPLSKKGQR